MIENDEEQKRQLLEELKKKEMGLAKEEGAPVETEPPDDYEPSETVKDIDKSLKLSQTLTQELSLRKTLINGVIILMTSIMRWS